MKRMSCIVVLIALRLFASSWAAETVGEASYTYIGPNDYQFLGCAGNALALLSGLSFSEAGYVSSETLGTPAALQIIAAGSYGGVLVWVGHGGDGSVTLESYEYTSAGLAQAESRIATLTGPYFAEGELALTSITIGTVWSWNVALTTTGIAAHFGGDNAIAVICACQSSTMGNAWHARVALEYSGIVYQNTITSDLNTLFGNLTADGRTDFSKMRVSQAVENTSFATPVGNADTALFPWVTSYTPDPDFFWYGDINRVTVNFGVNMTQTAMPFYVGGYGVVRGEHKWLSPTCAIVDIYSGWAIGNVFAGLDGENGRIKSSKDIPLLSGQDFYLTYYCAENSYPPAASVNDFTPCLESGTVRIYVDLAMLRGSRAFWIERDDGTVVGDTVRVSDMAGHTFEAVDPFGQPDGKYRLLEQEYNGKIFVRGIEGVFGSKPDVVLPRPDFEAEALENRLTNEFCQFSGQTLGSNIAVVICPDSFATAAQVYADYWTGHGRSVKVVTLTESGHTREAIRSYIVGCYAEGIRYVLLAGSASDHEWFDDPSKWPDSPGEDDWYYWYQDYHTPGGYVYLVSMPERDLIPTWFVADTAHDNMSYWTPYFQTDFPYIAGLEGMRLARVPAYNRARFLAWLAKNLEYCDHSGSYAWLSDVGIWGFCHSMDGNDGFMQRVLLEELSEKIPPSLHQYQLIDTAWTYVQRESIALDAWNTGRGIIYMQGTSSTYYNPIHFFSKSGGWHVGKLAAHMYPLVMGLSCGIGTHDMAVDPSWGDQFCLEVLTASNTRGTHAMVAPSRGTTAEGNRQIAESLNRFVSVESCQDLGTAFMLSQSEVISQGTQVLSALSYGLLGDPLAPLPGRSIATAIAEVPRFQNVLKQNYPNPFNPVTAIEYGLAEGTFVDLRVFDVAGRLVATLVSEQQTPGLHKVIWDSRGKASGIYFCRLRAGSFGDTKKMILLK